MIKTEEITIKRRNSGRVATATVATNCRNINYLIDKFDTYSEPTKTVSVISDFEKKKIVSMEDIQTQNELLFDSSFNEMEDKDIYIKIFGPFFQLVLQYTNINYKFKTLNKNYQKLKECIESKESDTVVSESEDNTYDESDDDYIVVDEDVNEVINNRNIDDICEVSEFISQTSCVFESQLAMSEVMFSQ